jgi:Z1 domain
MEREEHMQGRQETLSMARSMLEVRRRRDGIEAIPGDLARTVAGHAAAGTGLQGDDLEWVIRELEAEYSVTVDEKVRLILPGDADLPWEVRSGALQKDLYDLLARRGWGTRVIQSLEDSTGSILSRCGDPSRPGPWQRRGLVAGQVQSGKTTSYTALIAGAIDAGYRNIVVFTGRTNDLRHQTQERIDETIVGQESSFAQLSAPVRGRFRRPVAPRRPDSERPRVLGVGHIRAERRAGETWIPGLPPLLSLTSQDHRSGGTSGGDFNLRRAEHNNLAGQAITLAVSKKNGSVIKNLTRWLTRSGRIQEGPLLVVDDEADDSSIDVSADEMPSTINREIRKLLHAARQATYVAYTATPYANVMIDPDISNDDLGTDLFPGDFIALLDAPGNYMGAREFLQPAPGRQHFMEVKDAEGWIERGETHGPIPGSMIRSVQEFVVVTAARRARALRTGTDAGHASMLVHCDVRVDVQSQIVGELAEFLPVLRAGWNFPTGNDGVRESMLRRWLGDGEERGIEASQDAALAVTWEEVEPFIAGVLDDLDIQELNSSTKQNLDYRRASNEGRVLTVIAVGGHKLSRGLTLEGLSTSYLLRLTKLYDTLMQMGRWFGYRRGYEDLCRVHTTAAVLRNFLLVEEADSQLRDELRELHVLGASPRDVGMRVRHNPGMQITSSAKLRSTTTQQSGWPGRTVELTWFRPEDGPENDRIAGAFLDGLGDPRIGGKHAIWDDVSGETVTELLRTHREPPPASDGVRFSRAVDALRHIDVAQTTGSEKLALWRVVVSGINPESSDRVGRFGVERRRRQGVGTSEIRIKVVSDPKDEQYGVGAGSEGSRSTMKEHRDRNYGLLIGYPLSVSWDQAAPDGSPIDTFTWVVSFPPDRDILEAEYVLSVRAQERAL